MFEQDETSGLGPLAKRRRDLVIGGTFLFGVFGGVLLFGGDESNQIDTTDVEIDTADRDVAEQASAGVLIIGTPEGQTPVIEVQGIGEALAADRPEDAGEADPDNPATDPDNPVTDADATGPSGDTTSGDTTSGDTANDNASPTTTATTAPAGAGTRSTSTTADGGSGGRARPPSNPGAEPPSEVSAAAVRVGFDGHGGGAYNRSKQERDWNHDWSQRFDENSAVTGERSVSGGQSLRIRYPRYQAGGTQAAWRLEPAKEYYLSYAVLFAPGFDFNGDGHSGGKLPGLAAADHCSGGQRCDGTNGFTARYMWREDGRAQLYLYDMDRLNSFGREVFFADSSGAAVSFKPGTWHRLVQRVRTNSSGSRDGLVQVWMDGERVVDIGGLRFRTNDDLIDMIYFSTFFGGNSSEWYPDRDSYAFFDDFVVSTNPADVGL